MESRGTGNTCPGFPYLNRNDMVELQGVAAEDTPTDTKFVAFCLKCSWKITHPWKSDAHVSLITHACEEESGTREHA